MNIRSLPKTLHFVTCTFHKYHNVTKNVAYCHVHISLHHLCTLFLSCTYFTSPPVHYKQHTSHFKKLLLAITRQIFNIFQNQLDHKNCLDKNASNPEIIFIFNPQFLHNRYINLLKIITI